MTKNEFIQELGYLLVDIPEEERNEALEFYRNYFDEAGLEEEETVIMELGSPKEVADSIKKSLEYGSTEEGYFSENGFHNAYQEKTNLPVFSRYIRNDKDTGTNGSERSTTADSRDSYKNNSSNYKNSTAKDYKNKHNTGNTILLIILLFFGIPMAIPVAATIFALFVAVVATIFSIWIAFFAVSVAMLITGIVLALSGVFQLSISPALGLSLTGGGLIVFGVGILFAIATIWIAGKAIPAVFNWIKMIWNKIFQKRRVYA
ncbi:DUF1700 domain-containing protein [Anaerocolumna sp. AGMB13020]|uniref:DUF1700 domain-containing protein n=1 Tax=Anaerocolumna sp. AGMB13020 TaxID=3081750 RepID=UPI002955464C|nr:DUF1700 domain-containing protein [Anaerocolumna sp. AGMB13020]WOO37357.1 DUF1700 domain-containing protein [Anaerocolumna sp. AGMB13020]